MIEPAVSISTALIAGVVTAFLPCTFPILIGYLALLFGSKFRTTTQAISIAIRFCIGFTVVYTLFGVVAGIFGSFTSTTLNIGRIEDFLLYVGAVLFILIGFVMLRVVPLPPLAKKIWQVPIRSIISIDSWWMPLVVGAVFALGWSPCIGPILGSILFLAAASDSVFLGALLLSVFSLGLTVPLIIFSALFGLAKEKLVAVSRFSNMISAIGGILFIMLGIGFLFGAIGTFSELTNPLVLKLYGGIVV